MKNISLGLEEAVLLNSEGLSIEKNSFRFRV